MVPGGPFLSEKAISPQATAALEAKYGLDKPLGEQYVTYISGVTHGDFGDSLKQRGRTVAGIIQAKFPVSAKIGGISVLVSLILGVLLGSIAALKRGKFLDSLISVISTMGIAVPSFVICTVLDVFLWCEVQDTSYHGTFFMAELHYAGRSIGILPDSIYHETDAFFYA